MEKKQYSAKLFILTSFFSIYLFGVLFVFTASLIPVSSFVNTYYQSDFLSKYDMFNEGDFKINDTYSDARINAIKKQGIDKKLVVIDAGHGGIDPGSQNNGLLEKNISLDVALKINALLKRAGVNTILTRDKDVFVNVIDRIKLANTQKASLFISLHCDSFKDSKTNGISTLFYPSETLLTGNLNEVQYANIINNEIGKNLEIFNKGIIPRKDLIVLKHANMPSVVVELGFISGEKDSKLLSQESFRKKIADSINKAIIIALEKINSK